MKMADVQVGMRLVAKWTDYAMSPITVTKVFGDSFEYRLDKPIGPISSHGHIHTGKDGEAAYELACLHCNGSGRPTTTGRGCQFCNNTQEMLFKLLGVKCPKCHGTGKMTS